VKKVLFTALVSAALLALGPASSLARDHHSRSHHHRVQHARAHIRHFGTRDVTTSGTPGAISSGSAGTVASFTDGVLTLRLNDGSQVSGKVTGATELECSAGMMDIRTEDGGPGGDRGGDQGGDHGDGRNGGDRDGGDRNRGDDNGGDADEGGAPSCTMSALAHGAVVQDAELKVSSAGAIWDNVELAQ
jgi:hypothetical protein